METRPDHWLRIVATAVLVALSVGVPAATADGGDPPDWPNTITVHTDPDNVIVDSNVHGNEPGGSGTQAAGGGPHCYLSEIKEMDEDLTLEYWARRMRYAPYYVICDGQRQGVVWIEINLNEPQPNQSADPRDIAMHLRDVMPIPRATVDMNPSSGVVGVESWFWLQGYSGSPVTDSTNAFGSLVEVEATVTRYEWSFGDGATLTSETPGRAYPARSDVRHVYERSSAGAPEGYSVDVTFVFAVRYRVDGGRWIEIPGITRTAHADYPVRESQAVIQR